MICGAVMALSTEAHGQGVFLNIIPTTVDGLARQMVGPQVVRITNQGGSDATNLTVTLNPPKGAKLDAAGCQENHLPGGLRSYTCLVGSLAPWQEVDITFSISMNKSATADVGIDAACDQGDFGALLTILIS